MMKNSGFLGAVESLLDAQDEHSIYLTLVSLAAPFGFEASRVYLVNRCPFRDVFVYTLAAQSPPERAAKDIGYRIEHPTIHRDAQFAFERASVGLRDTDKKTWIEDLGLVGEEWMDLELRGDGAREGLWSLSRKETDKAINDDTTLQLLCLAKLASRQIQGKRSSRALSALSLIDVKRQSVNRADDDNIMRALTEIQQSLGAAFVAFFRWSPAKLCLVKELEISDKHGRVEFGSTVDYAYPVGVSLTGSAYQDASLKFVPFFDRMREARPELANEASIAAHELSSSGALTSVIYQTLAPIASCPGVVRVINRAESSVLPFQEHDAALLKQLVGFMERALSVDAAGALLSNIEAAVDKVLDLRVSQDNANVACESVLSDLGFSGFQVLRFDSSGAFLPSGSWTRIAPPRVHGVDDVNRITAQLRRAESDQRIRAHFSSDGRHNRAALSFIRSLGVKEPFIFSYFIHSGGITLIVLPVPLEAPDTVGGDFWHHNPALRNALLVIVELCAHGISMRANRDLLRDAETSVAVIAHEFRSPSVSIRSLANTLITDISRVLNNSTLTVTDRIAVAPPGEVSYVASAADVMRYLEIVGDRVRTSDMRLSRAVKDGLMWARMASSVIELEFAKVQLADLYEMALEEVRFDLMRRANVRIRVKGVRSLPQIVVVPDLIQGLLVNLLDNAIKYSFERQTIEIVGTQVGGGVELAIANFGLGIHEEDMPHIFTPFYRAKHRDPRHPIRGVGLGLPTCQRVVSLHQGSIRVESKRGYSDVVRTDRMEGFLTTFTVYIPSALSAGRRDVQAPGS